MNEIKKLIDINALPSLEREAKFRREYNKNLVKVTTHGDSCDKCKKWEGKILNDDVFTSFKINKKYGLLSYAIKDGLFHNGCRHGLTTYYPELENISYNKDETLIDKNKILIIHLILFIFTAGIGNIIYLIHKKHN